MDKLGLELKKILPYIIDAYSNVYGDEYQDIISQRLNNTIIIPYYDIEGLEDYLLDIRRCKRREYAIKFLDKIGLDIKEYIKDNYTQSLDPKIEKILEYYMYSYNAGFSDYADSIVPLKAFKENDEVHPNILLRNKLKIINYLLGDNHEKITEENFGLFEKTNEYQEILKKINLLNEVYEKLLLEYKEWELQLKPYDDFVESEKNRKKDILYRYKTMMLSEIYCKVSQDVVDAIANKTLDEKCRIILGTNDIGLKCLIESFSLEEMQKLNSKDVDFNKKFWIINSQSKYLKNLGVVFPDEDILDCDSEEDVDKYLAFFNQDDVKKYLPSDDLVNHTTFVRKRNYDEALNEYYKTRQDFINALNKYYRNSIDFSNFYEQIKNKKVCITGEGACNDNNEFVSLLFYTIRMGDFGKLLQSFIHECGHIIDQPNSNGVGFESFDEILINNPYDKAFRKYEKFNETINDIFTIEALELLYNQGIYLIEPLKYTILDNNIRYNCNTAVITKELLQPLLRKFRKQVVKAKVNADANELIRYIGEDNYEELVDVVNIVDYYTRNGLVFKMEKMPDDEMVKDYYIQLERVKKIYDKIDIYYRNNIEILTLDSDDDFKKSM